MLFSLAILVIAAMVTFRFPMAGIAIAAQGYLIRSAFITGSAKAGLEGPVTGVLLPLAVFSVIAIRLMLKRSRVAVRPTPMDLALPALGIVMLVGIAFAPNAAHGIDVTARFWALGLSYYVMARLALAEAGEATGIRVFLLTTWGIGVLLGVVALLQPSEFTGGRLSIGSAHPIPFSLLLGMALLINTFWVLTRAGAGRPPRPLQYAAFPFLGYVFIASNSRGTTISLVVSLALMLLPVVWSRRPRAGALRARTLLRVGVLAAAAAGGAVAWFRHHPDFIERLLRGLITITSDNKGESILDRISAYQTAFSLFRNHPVVGVGTGGFAHYHLLEYPHNLVLEVAADHGMIGLLVLLVLGIAIVRAALGATRRGARRGDTTPILVAGLIALTLIEAQFSFTLWMHKHLYIALALLVAYQRFLNKPAVIPVAADRTPPAGAVHHPHPA